MAKRRSQYVAAETALRDLGLDPMPLSLEETIALRDAWRRVYARPLKRDLGVWHRGGYDWHVFSYTHTHALEREPARIAYRAERCTELIILPNDEPDLACRVRTATTPALDGEQDVYISPPDLAWTMVFTHEDGWLGPYFSRASWVDSPPAPPAAEPPRKRRPRNGSRR